MKSDDEVNEITLHVRQSSVIKFQFFWIRDSVMKDPFQIFNVFLFLFVYSEMNITLI